MGFLAQSSPVKGLVAVLAILRPHNMLGTAAGVLCGYHLAGGESYAEIVLALAVTACVTGFGNVINDYYDLEIDRVNKPHRPLPSGALNPRQVRVGYWLGTAVVTAVAMLALPLAWVALVVTWQALLFVYARAAKRVAVVGNLMISAIVASTFLGGALFTGNLRAAAYPVFLSFLFVMGRELIKGAEDIEGDRAGGAVTLAVRWGVGRTVVAGSLVLFLCALVAPYPGLAGDYGRWYLAGMEILFVPGLLVAGAMILHSPNKAVFRRTSRLLKVLMLVAVGVLAIARV